MIHLLKYLHCSRKKYFSFKYNLYFNVEDGGGGGGDGGGWEVRGSTRRKPDEESVSLKLG